jgi:hypothetical protein
MIELELHLQLGTGKAGVSSARHGAHHRPTSEPPNAFHVHLHCIRGTLALKNFFLLCVRVNSSV